MARQARAEATRNKLLEATVSALAERGYAGTTTQEVCRRAGCSRGTLLYHFSKREDLLVAALDFVLNERVRSFVADHQELAQGDVEDFLRALWRQWQGPALAAWLELAVAARTQPSLREPMRATMLQFDEQVRWAFRTLQPLGQLPPELAEPAPFMVFAILNGLAVGQSYEEPGHSEPVLQMLVHFARSMEVEP